MKWLLIGVLLVMSYGIIQANAQSNCRSCFPNPPGLPSPFIPNPPGLPSPYNPNLPTRPSDRFARSPQESVGASASQPSVGHPQLNLDYYKEFMSGDKSNFEGYGGVSSSNSKHV